VAEIAGVAPLDDDEPGELGPYRLLGRLGDGGMGSVYLARRRDITEHAPRGDDGPLVAVKVIRPDLARVPEFRARFLREAQAARRVARFCTAEVLDVDVDGSRPYLVTEFVDGPTLWAAVRDQGPMPEVRLERLAVAVASALSAIHAAGIVHRDLKPGNILLSRSGARVIDFGIARALDSVTQLTHGSIGTPGFMAPEQALGQPVGTAADVYAWGAVMVFAAAGRPPFGEGPTPVILHRVATQAPDLSGVPAALRPVVARTMAKDPAGRPSADELLLLLHRTHSTPEPPGQARTGAAGVTRPPRPALAEDSASTTTRPLPPPELAAPAAPTAGPAVRAVGPQTVGPQTVGLGPPRPAAAVPGPPLPAPPGGPAVSAPGGPQLDAPSGPQPGPAAVGPGRSSRRLVAALSAITALAVAVAVTTTVLAATGHRGAGDGPAVLGTASRGAATATATRAVPATTAESLARRPPRPVAHFSVEHVYGDVTFSPAGHLLAVVDHPLDIPTLCLWDVTDPAEPEWLLPNSVTVADGTPVFSPDGHLLTLWGADGSIQLWDVTSPAEPKLAGRVTPTGPDDRNTHDLAFAPGGALATSQGDGTIQFWDVTNRTSPARVGEPLVSLGGGTDDPDDRYFTGMAFAPDGRTFATGEPDGAVRFWDVSDLGSPKQVSRPFNAAGAWWMRFTPDSHTLITVGSAIRLWDVKDLTNPRPLGQPLFEVPSNGGFDIGLSPDGTVLAVDDQSDAIRFWDLTDPGHLTPLGEPVHNLGGWGFDFSSDGRALATAGETDPIVIWELD